MQWVLIILISVGGFALSGYLKNKKKNELASKGRYVERGNEFFKQGHYFFTKTCDFSTIAGAIDQNALFEEKISYEPNIEQGQIVFHNRISFGSFGARLRYLGQREQDGLHAYSYQVEAWRDGQYGITRQDLYGANALLTLIEKAFLRLDPATEVQRDAAEYKTKIFCRG